MFTCCVLLYGDYPELAQRCLNDSLLAFLALDEAYELRIGINEISEATWGVIHEVVARVAGKTTLFGAADGGNLCKYPMARKMFYELPLTTPYVMWFDDDAYIHSGLEIAPWRDKIVTLMQDADVIGAKYRQSFTGRQRDWIQAQPWYAGKPPRAYADFIQGSWWTVRTEVLTRFNWPTPDFVHCGGDSMFGELCRQQDLRMRQFKDHLGINADKYGRESESPRRGYRSRPIGFDFRPPAYTGD